MKVREDRFLKGEMFGSFCGWQFLNAKRTDKQKKDLLGLLDINSDEIVINSDEIVANLKVETLGILGTSNKSLKWLITQLFYPATDVL